MTGGVLSRSAQICRTDSTNTDTDTADAQSANHTNPGSVRMSRLKEPHIDIDALSTSCQIRKRMGAQENEVGADDKVGA
jgi:hypothetical protein